MLVIDLAGIVHPIDVDAELLIALSVGLLDIGGHGLADDDVAGRRPKGSRDLVFLERGEPLGRMGVHLAGIAHPRAGDGHSVLGIKVGYALGIARSIEALDVLHPGFGILHRHRSTHRDAPPNFQRARRNHAARLRRPSRSEPAQRLWRGARKARASPFPSGRRSRWSRA